MGVNEDVVELLTVKLSAAALTDDAGSLLVPFAVMVGNPPHLAARDLLFGSGFRVAVSALFTVADLRGEWRRITGQRPLVNDGRHLVKTWTVAKTGLDGVKLQQKMQNEVTRVFCTNPTFGYVVDWSNEDRYLQGSWVYCTVFTVAVTRFLLL